MNFSMGRGNFLLFGLNSYSREVMLVTSKLRIHECKVLAYFCKKMYLVTAHSNYLTKVLLAESF